MRIAIVEDRAEDQENLRKLFSEEAREREWAYTVETYPSGEAFLAAAGRFDLVFLDVMMDGIDGLETARKFRGKGGNALIVFVTIEEGFAVEGYEVEAAAFLVKPAEKERLHRVLDRLSRKLRPDVLLEFSGDMEFPVNAILYASAADHCLKVHTTERDFFPDFSMEELRSRLPDDGRFIECSRGVLVNLDHVSKVDAKAVTMDDGTRLPVSRRRRQTLVDKMADWKFDGARGDTP